MDLAMTNKKMSLCWLCIGAFFFAVRSCECLKISHKEDSKRTKIISLRNIKARKNGKALDFRVKDEVQSS